MVTLAQFGRNMNRQAARVDTNSLRVKKLAAGYVLNHVVRATPLDTGRARFHWNVSMNLPNNAYDYASFNGHGRTGDWVGKLGASSAAIIAATRKDSIYISNGLPYIGELNRGWSSQAPRDFVRISALVGIRALNGFRILR